MDFYQFINSQDIREHLTEIEYQFTSLECAFIVWQSLNHTLAQKWEAWEWLIENTSDCAVPERMNCAGWKSLHGFLKSYIDLEKKYLSLFERTADNAVYTFDIQDDLGRRDREKDVFSSLNDCLRCAKNDYLDEYEDYVLPVVTKNFIRKEGVATHTPVLNMEYTRDLEPKEITFYCFNEAAVHASCLDDEWIMSEEDSDLAYLSFNGMWFDIPTPFEKGDIVCEINHDNPFLLDGLLSWLGKKEGSTTRDKKRYEHGKAYGWDTSDMTAFGYGYDNQRYEICYEDNTFSYLNLEYWHRPLQDGARMLNAFSLQMKGEIDTFALLRTARRFALDANAKREHQFPEYVWDKKLKKAMNFDNNE